MFRAGWGGTYQVTLSLQNSDHNNEKSQGLKLLKNGESVSEVYFYTKYEDNSATKDGKKEAKPGSELTEFLLQRPSTR